MEEAMAREVSEVLRSQALRAAREHFDEQTMKDRIIPMRWLLTWKPLTEPGSPSDAPSAKADCKRQRLESSSLGTITQILRSEIRGPVPVYCRQPHQQ